MHVTLATVRNTVCGMKLKTTIRDELWKSTAPSIYSMQ